MKETLVVHDDEINEIFEVRLLSVKHQYVTTNRRSYAAIRQEIIHSATNFISKRLNVEAKGIIKHMENILRFHIFTKTMTAEA